MNHLKHKWNLFQPNTKGRRGRSKSIPFTSLPFFVELPSFCFAKLLVHPYKNKDFTATWILTIKILCHKIEELLKWLCELLNHNSWPQRSIGIIHLVCTQHFSYNKHFPPPDKHTFELEIFVFRKIKWMNAKKIPK